MVLGLPSGMVSGFVDRWQEIDDEKTASASAHAKALKAKIEGWQKLNPIQSVISGELKIKDMEFPKWLPAHYQSSYRRAEGQATERGIEEKVGKYYEGIAAGKFPNPDMIGLHKKIKSGIATGMDIRVFSDIRNIYKNPKDPANIKRFASVGGFFAMTEMGNKNREIIRRKGVTDMYTPTDSVDLYHLPGWGRDRKYGTPALGESVVVNKRVLQNASIISGRGAPQPTILMASSENNRGAMTVGSNVHATQDANIDLMGAIDKAVADTPELAQALGQNGGRVRKDVQNWLQMLRQTPLSGEPGSKPVGGGEWVDKAFPNIIKALNQKPPSADAAQESFINSAANVQSSKTIKISKNHHSSSESDFFNNMSVIEKQVSSDMVVLAFATDFRGTEQTLKGNLDSQVDSLTNLTYRQSINVRDAFNAFTKGKMPSNVYFKTITDNMPNLLSSDTNIVNFGKIYEMTMIALEAQELQGENAHKTRARRHIRGGVYKEHVSGKSQYLDKAIDTSEGQGLRAFKEYNKRRTALNEMSAELQIIISYLGESGGKEGIPLDDAMLNSGDANLKVTGMYSDLIQKVQTGLINIKDVLAGAMGMSIGTGREKDPYLHAALKEGNGLNPKNRTMLQRLSDRVNKHRGKTKGETNRAYLQRAVIEFKKLALTYKLSGMVQGESTGGRTISNQDFEVMLKALWGTQEASQVRMQSLLQRIETLKTVNNVDWRLRESGTFSKFGNHSISNTLRLEMHKNFHRNLQGRVKPYFAGGQEPDEVITAEGKLTSGESRSPKTYIEALSHLSRELSDRVKYPRLSVNDPKLTDADKEELENSYKLLDMMFGEGDNVLFRRIQRVTDTYMKSHKEIRTRVQRHADYKTFFTVWKAGMTHLNKDSTKTNLDVALRYTGVKSQKQRNYIYGSYVSLYRAIGDEVKAMFDPQ